ETNLVGLIGGVGRHLEPMRATPAADRRDVRPVRRTGPGAMVVRNLRRRPVHSGGYALGGDAGAGRRRPPVDQDTLDRAGTAVVPEALAAAERLEQAGVGADLVCVTSPGLLFEAWQARGGRSRAESWVLDQVLPPDRAAPMVTVLDGHPHTLAFLAAVNQVRS